MRVRSGRVAKKNNWVPNAGDYYARPQSEIRIERSEPGPGYRHIVTVSQLRRFLALLPDWEELAVGLEAISIWKGNPRLGWTIQPRGGGDHGLAAGDVVAGRTLLGG